MKKTKLNFFEKIMWYLLNPYKPKPNEEETIEFDYYYLKVIPKKKKNYRGK